MPVHTGKDSKGCFAQWGGSGKKYYYICGNSKAKASAKSKAAKQGVAAYASGFVEKETTIDDRIADKLSLLSINR